jgi:hypothetical protein
MYPMQERATHCCRAEAADHAAGALQEVLPFGHRWLASHYFSLCAVEWGGEVWDLLRAKVGCQVMAILRCVGPGHWRYVFPAQPVTPLGATGGSQATPGGVS